MRSTCFPAWLGAVLFACRAAPEADSTPSRGPVPPATGSTAASAALRARAEDAGGSSGFLPCPAGSPAAPPLTSYVGVDRSHPYSVTVAWSGSEWLPSPPIRPPEHHASRLELDNIADFPALERRRERGLRLTVRLTHDDVQKVSDRDAWRSSVHARVLSICELSALPG